MNALPQSDGRRVVRVVKVPSKRRTWQRAPPHTHPCTVSYSVKLQVPSESDTHPGQTPIRVRHPSGSDTHPSQTPIRVRHPSESDTHLSQTPIRVRHPSGSDTHPSQTPIRVRHPNKRRTWQRAHPYTAGSPHVPSRSEVRTLTGRRRGI